MVEYGKSSGSSSAKPVASIEQSIQVASSASGRPSRRQFEYKHIRLDYKGRGITQEINILDIDGQRIRGWGASGDVPTLPEMLAALGKDGWEMVSHVVNQDNTANGVTFHYYNFKREL